MKWVIFILVFNHAGGIAKIETGEFSSLSHCKEVLENADFSQFADIRVGRTNRAWGPYVTATCVEQKGKQ